MGRQEPIVRRNVSKHFGCGNRKKRGNKYPIDYYKSSHKIFSTLLKVKLHMKPNIDLKNPFVQTLMSEYGKKVLFALNAEQSVEKAVLPIYHMSSKGTKLQQIASGVLINICDQYFMLSASHVFDQIGDYALCIGDGMGHPVIQLPGERFSSPKGNSGKHLDDIIDASVYRFQAKLPDTLKARAITLEDFDTSDDDSSNTIFLSVGYRIRKSNSTNYFIRSKCEAFPSIEIQEKDYLKLSLNSEISIALWHNEYMVMDGLWQLSPRPRGFSGGAIIKVAPVFSNGTIIYKQKLVGIITEHRKRTKDIDGVLVGTRISIHLAAIQKYMPMLNFDI